MGIDSWPMWGVVACFLGATAVIVAAGTKLAGLADRLADRTGLGEAVFGAVLLGGVTSLPGIVTSVTAAVGGYAELAVSNAVGGVAAQTAFLAIADIAHRRVNLEHAAASVENLIQAALLSTLLAVPLLAMAGPEVTFLGVHPASVILIVAYLFGIRLVTRAHESPLWKPKVTRETRTDKPEERSFQGASLTMVWSEFVGLGLVVAFAGYAVAAAGIALSNRTELSETLVGAFLTAVATSLPELVTSVAAVRRGALTLAVGTIIGGNAFDVLFVAFSDFGFRSGSIYHAITNRQVFIIALTILMTGILMLGMLRREKKGIANIGFESFLVLVCYAGTFFLIFTVF